ncbi:hypothetical protein GGF31_003657 [Allomyces arbusculus]|nr:hypothetical protein GGF31_003657 [Allomyces arbusculus]
MHSAKPHQLRWSTVAIPFAQLRYIHVEFALRNFTVPPACRCISINSRHDEISDEFPAYPPTITSLHLSMFVDPSAMRPQFPPTLRDLTLAYPIKEDLPELGIMQVYYHSLVHVDELSAILDALAAHENSADGSFQPLQSLTLRHLRGPAAWFARIDA